MIFSTSLGLFARFYGIQNDKPILHFTTKAQEILHSAPLRCRGSLGTISEISCVIIYNLYKHGALVVWDRFHIIVKQEFVQIPASLTGTNIYYLLNFYMGCNIKHDGPRHG